MGPRSFLVKGNAVEFLKFGFSASIGRPYVRLRGFGFLLCQKHTGLGNGCVCRLAF